jgi:hypothetical protein
MSEETAAKRASDFYSEPFVPSQTSGTGLDSPGVVRMAAAAEYAAAQLGIIARAVEKIETHLTTISANSEMQRITSLSKR